MSILCYLYFYVIFIYISYPTSTPSPTQKVTGDSELKYRGLYATETQDYFLENPIGNFLVFKTS